MGPCQTMDPLDLLRHTIRLLSVRKTRTPAPARCHHSMVSFARQVFALDWCVVGVRFDLSGGQGKFTVYLCRGADALRVCLVAVGFWTTKSARNNYQNQRNLRKAPLVMGYQTLVRTPRPSIMTTETSFGSVALGPSPLLFVKHPSISAFMIVLRKSTSQVSFLLMVQSCRLVYFLYNQFHRRYPMTPCRKARNLVPQPLGSFEGCCVGRDGIQRHGK